jgi:hypothetical protein
MPIVSPAFLLRCSTASGRQLLCLDVGTKSTGLAVSVGDSMAYPLKTIAHAKGIIFALVNWYHFSKENFKRQLPNSTESSMITT